MRESSRKLAVMLGLTFLILLAVLLVIRILRQGIYSNQLGMNIVVLGKEKVGLLMIRPEEDVVGWVIFPKNLTIKIFDSDARYPVVSLWELGQLERNPYDIVEKSIGTSMGVVIARTINVGSDVSVEGIVANIHKLHLKTNLSLRDRFLIRKFLVSSLSSKKILEMDVPLKIFDKSVEPDGKEVLAFNSVALLWTKNKFVLESILSENVELGVNNLSGQIGLGTQVARQLESAGVRVVEVKSDPMVDITGKGCMYAINGKYPFTELLLTNHMRCVKIDDSSTMAEKGIAVWLK